MASQQKLRQIVIQYSHTGLDPVSQGMCLKAGHGDPASGCGVTNK